MTTIMVDTRLLMDDFLQRYDLLNHNMWHRNEKLKNLIGESLPSKEKRSKMQLSNETFKPEQSFT